MGDLGATLTQVSTCARGRSGRVTQRCHNSPRWETGLASANDVTHRKRAEDFGRFWKSQWVELRQETEREGLTFACSWRPWAGVTRDKGGGRWKGQNRKIVPLSPYVEKPLNSKVIKSFVPELWSRKCFSCFEIPMFYVIYIYIYIYEHYMSIAHIRIWLWYNGTKSEKWFQPFLVIDQLRFRRKVKTMGHPVRIKHTALWAYETCLVTNVT